MTSLDLLSMLTGGGVNLIAIGDRLTYDAPEGMMTPELLGVIKSRKLELLAILSGDWKAAATALLAQVHDNQDRAELQHLFDERAGVAEYDGKLSRSEAERLAYSEVAQAYVMAMLKTALTCQVPQERENLASSPVGENPVLKADSEPGTISTCQEDLSWH